MKFKFTDEQGNDYVVTINVRDCHNLNVTKKATRLVMAEMANLFSSAGYAWRKLGMYISSNYASMNAKYIIDAIQEYKNEILRHHNY